MHIRSAFGMSPCLSELVLSCYLFCSSSLGWSSGLGSGAAATTLRGPTLLPQPLRGEKIVPDSIYFR